MTPYKFICKSNIYIFFFLILIEVVESKLYVGSFKYPVNIYLFKLNNSHDRTSCGMYSVLAIKTPERRHSLYSDVFIANFEHI